MRTFDRSRRRELSRSWTAWLVAALIAIVSLRAISILLHPFPPTMTAWLQKSAAASVFFGAAVLCAVKGRSARGERCAWWSFACALVLWGSGDLYYTVVLSERDSVPYPSLADGLWLAFYPAAYVAIISLTRRRAGSVSRAARLDALIGGLGVGSAGAALAFGVVLDNTSGTALATATNLAYPVGDLGLLALVVAAISVTGWRAAGVWRKVAVAFGIFVVADSVYLVEVADGTYSLGGVVDLGWPVAALLIGLAAWGADPVRQARAPAERCVAVPAVSGGVALGLLVADHFVQTNLLALGLAAASIVLILVRQHLAVRDNGRLLHQSRDDATTDALTGLGNRRRLSADLAVHLRELDADRPVTLTLFDLDGFKQYNDTFGHPAGDRLLERLATKFRDALAGRGTAYRIGGDEFCSLWTGADHLHPDQIVVDALAALAENGEAFSIGCSHGSVVLPTETADPTDAMRIADRKMYVRKRSGRASAGWQSVDALHQVLAESDPDFGDHIGGVRDLAVATARWFHLSPEELELTAQTALLHDLGKVGLPDEILNKAGPLDDVEWAFVHQHTLIAERIISAAPALAAVAVLVRATPEHHDGSGYPDGLAGDRIPLISRIVAVCAAFDAMVMGRPYLPARTPSAAVAELQRCAGSQFDHVVVEAFVTVLGQSDERRLVDASSTHE